MLNTSAPERGRACFAERSLVRRLHVSPNACESIWKNKVFMCKVPTRNVYSCVFLPFGAVA